jgi:serine/threonine-protein kinase HipA
LKALVVWIADERVGELVLKDNVNLQFRYDPAYVGPPISHALPKQREAHPHAAAKAVFGGLLPEADVRETLARNLGVSVTNDYALLAELGGDVAGALTLLEEGQQPTTEQTSLTLGPDDVDRLLTELPQRPLAADPEEGIRLSLAGAQAKLPIIINEAGTMALPTSAAAATTHILKPEPPRFPGLVDNEAFCMDLARACGLETAAVRKDRTASGLPYLIVERYDRDLTTEPIRRLQQEDFCQALARPSEIKYQNEGGPSIAECVDLLRAATSLPAQELPRFMAAVIFNWSVGNCDGHGKNYSLLYDRGAPTLAPLYDLVSTVEYKELTSRLAMSIDGARKLEEINDHAWDQLAADISYRAATLRSARSALVQRAAEQAARLIAQPEHDNDTARAIARRVTALQSDTA